MFQLILPLSLSLLSLKVPSIESSAMHRQLRLLVFPHLVLRAPFAPPIVLVQSHFFCRQTLPLPASHGTPTHAHLRASRASDASTEAKSSALRKLQKFQDNTAFISNSASALEALGAAPTAVRIF